jgi:NitT/TauT family transport system ATP-binding protein
MTDPIIRVDAVSKTYPTRDGEIFAVDDVSLDVPNGGFISLLGPSGCGKSTLLLMIAGLLSASRGTITVDGTTVKKPYTDLGIVFQDANLLDWRSVLKNLLIQAEIRGMSAADTKSRAHRLLNMVGLDGYADRFPYELSGGMRQRVSICRALVHDPPLLLMDEPFGALDALTRDQLNLDLQDIWIESGKTVLFVTHSITEAVFLSDTVVVMTPRPGKIGKVFNIDLPRPRNYATRDSDAFGRYTKEIRGLFEEWGVLRDHTPRQTSEARP